MQNVSNTPRIAAGRFIIILPGRSAKRQQKITQGGKDIDFKHLRSLEKVLDVRLTKH
jgi:hypothetical protein